MCGPSGLRQGYRLLDSDLCTSGGRLMSESERERIWRGSYETVSGQTEIYVGLRCSLSFVGKVARDRGSEMMAE